MDAFKNMLPEEMEEMKIDIETVFIPAAQISVLSRCEESPCLLMEADVLPAANASSAAEYEDNGLEKEEELGIFQVLDRLEEVTNILISR